MDYLAVFQTTSYSMKFKRKLQKDGIPAEALPVPRSISSSCGIAIRFRWEHDPIQLMGIGVDRLYRYENNEYYPIFGQDVHSTDHQE